jgi:hypothetical protein
MVAFSKYLHAREVVTMRTVEGRTVRLWAATAREPTPPNDQTLRTVQMVMGRACAQSAFTTATGAVQASGPEGKLGLQARATAVSAYTHRRTRRLGESSERQGPVVSRPIPFRRDHRHGIPTTRSPSRRTALNPTISNTSFVVCTIGWPAETTTQPSSGISTFPRAAAAPPRNTATSATLLRDERTSTPAPGANSVRAASSGLAKAGRLVT